MKKLLVLAVPFVALAAFGVAESASAKSGKTTASVKVMVRKVPKLGSILVDSKGHTLYMFVPDKQKKVTCVKICAAVWPPLKLVGKKAVAGNGVKASLLGSDKNPAGGRVVTYNKWPLYTYVSDLAPGQAKGQALNLNGGYWYVLSPSGKLIKKKV
jgi:predicted lipoprotein with Yx(FWY)xxD motif